MVAQAESKPTRRQQAAATEQSILDAAGRLFAEKGFTSVTTKELAEASGVAVGAIYHHFSGKEALYAAVLQRAMSDRFVLPQHLLESGAEPYRRLVDVIEWFTETVLSDNTLRILLSRELLAPTAREEYPILDVATFERAFEAFGDALEELVPGVDREEAAATALNLAYGFSNLTGIYAIMPSAEPIGRSPRDIAEYTARLLVSGVGSADR